MHSLESPGWQADFLFVAEMTTPIALRLAEALQGAKPTILGLGLSVIYIYFHLRSRTQFFDA